MRAASVVANSSDAAASHGGPKSPTELQRQGFDTVANDLNSRERFEFEELTNEGVPQNVCTLIRLPSLFCAV